MSNKISDLHPEFQPYAKELIRRAEDELGFKMVVVDTLRTPVEQKLNLARGVSKTLKSKHLMQPCCEKSHAIDIVPKHLAKLKNWAPEHPDWLLLGKLGESLHKNISWGGRWKGKFHIPGTKVYSIVDCPHFQWDDFKKTNGLPQG
jgi:hypothetical protein